MRKQILFLLACSLAFTVKAQKTYWTAHINAARVATDKAVSRLTFPKEFKLFDLNLSAIRQELFTCADNRQRHSTNISLPNADGQIEQFEVFEASNFEPALQAQFPEIRAFSGRGITDPSATLKLSISPQGIQTMIFRTDKDNEFIEPYSQDHTVYAAFKSHRNASGLPWSCSTVEQPVVAGLNTAVTNATARSGGNLKTMRLAQSVTAEYSNYFGATSASQVSLVLAAVNNTLTRCNGVYEKDLAVHLNLIASTTSVFYYNASTDPYSAASTGAGGAWNSELQSTLTSVIGEANYDIGHLFGASGGGGNAGCIGCICTNGSKGSGFTSPADGIPQGDNFDIDYVVHEVGHQMGANHTFSYANEGTGVNKEIGSGITIMGYAGITSYDVASHSIDIYHQASIAQIQTNLNSKTCPVTTTITNSTPVVATLTNYTIPISTPFSLTGSATDANSTDVLTYCWEQNDNASSSQTNANSKASATKATGPNWISFRPTTSPTRYFPQLSSILAGATTTGPMTGGDAGVTTEALSSVARTLNFRLTVRDNAPYSSTAPVNVGQTQFADMVVTVSAASGPFAVTSPNTAVSWAGGSSQAITWSVASTTAAPVSCANVKISLSTDGGQTFPTVLIASTPNDGTETLVIPNTPTTTARIKVEAVGNIFFDISNANFTITAGSSCGTATGLSSSAITTTGATVSWTAVSGANSYAVDYKLNTSATWTSFSTAQTATTANLTGLASGTLYNWRVTATCSSGTGAAASAQFTTLVPCTAPTGLSSSAVTANSATVSWSAVSAATSYAVDYKLNSSSTWTSFSTAQTGTSANLTGLSASSVYDWRVSATCPSGTTSATSAQFTTTAPAACNAPAGLSSTVTSNSATVSWTAVSGAVSYAVDYKLNTSSTWTSFSTAQTGTTATITGLLASTVYDWRVTTNCSSGSSTATAAQFTTTAASTCATAFEPNETQATAAAISSGVTNSAAISSTTDIDYYKITTTATSNIVYNLVGPSGVDFDLYIYNSAGTQIGSGAGSTATETVSLTSQAAGTYYIKVIGYNGANSATCYTIKATATAITGCQSSYDNSTNGTTSGAATIPFNTNVTGLISPSADVDNYKFVITTGGTITVTLSTLPADFDLKLLNSAGTQVGISQNGSTTSETISYTAAAGTYYAQVYGYSGANSSTTCYTLKVQLGTATRDISIPVSVVSEKNPVALYPNPVTSTLNIGLSGEINNNSSFVVMDAKGVVVLQQKFVRNPQSVDVSKLASGVYVIKVNNAGNIVTEKFIKQ
ncbi:MAG: fibronectin type III domain-containing protein [Bacteroidetes bacterium]|nr:fibronectin type III domain-containing protein [Bacteroidota bacterium]